MGLGGCMKIVMATKVNMYKAITTKTYTFTYSSFIRGGVCVSGRGEGGGGVRMRDNRNGY